MLQCFVDIFREHEDTNLKQVALSSFDQKRIILVDRIRHIAGALAVFASVTRSAQIQPHDAVVRTLFDRPP